MIIGERLRQIREQRNLSQADLEHKTGLLRCHISRIENGHLIPGVDTLEKLARGLKIPLYQLFYDQEEPPALPAPPKQKKNSPDEWGAHGKQAWLWRRFHTLLGKMELGDRDLLLSMAKKMTAKDKG